MIKIARPIRRYSQNVGCNCIGRELIISVLTLRICQTANMTNAVV